MTHSQTALIAVLIGAAAAMPPTMEAEPLAAEGVEARGSRLTVDPAALMAAPLSQKVSLEFNGQSLREVADWIVANLDLKVRLDQSALRYDSVPLDDHIHESLQEEPLYFLLDRLGAMGIAWVYRDGMLTFTSEDGISSHMITRAYDLGDLLDRGYGREQLLHLLEKVVRPEEWYGSSGEGRAQWLGDVLVVTHAARPQLELQGLFSVLRSPDGRTFVCDPPAHDSIRRRLRQPVRIRMGETPLSEAIKGLADAAAIDIRCDGYSDIDLAKPASLDCSGGRLFDALQELVRDRDLTWGIVAGQVWISSRWPAESMLKTAVYDVLDLCGDLDSTVTLADLIESQAAPESWDGVGNGGVLAVAKPGVLVIRQSDPVHDEVAALLDEVRRVHHAAGQRDHYGPDPAEVVTHYYVMSHDMAKSMAENLPKLVQPWTAPNQAEADGVGSIRLVVSEDREQRAKDGTMRWVPQATLVIRHTRETHEQIRVAIHQVRFGDSRMIGAAASE
ncbi:hypothetical protein KOR34_33830 [Posidoniimonas corsicana]|uniref:Uncharacterized protein n=2 Tax=Posidoniimonas corsicana TaxID=1938618 RepID=A0A5C5V5G6_9BACT|nr:hypothetical protein KOR34_33830 [Posidoniimonas corsicana]